MKPGKPFTFATVEMHGKKKLFFGLPGNPVSGIVTFYLLCLPAIRKLAGYTDQQIPLTRVLAQVNLLKILFLTF
jgi:molybdopterin biosynthesis enzyme